MCRVLFAVICCFISCIFCQSFGGESHFVILICSYNNVRYIEKNILSALNQRYDHFRVIYVDDASNDGTDEVLKATLEKYDTSHIVKVIRNERRQGTPLANHYYTIHREIHDEEIVVLLDGDDCLANQGVLTYLDGIYRGKKKIWMTYGQFKGAQSGQLGFCCEFPREIVHRHAFREYQHMPSHLKTFYAWLFKKIHREDLLYEGDFYKMSGDLAIMLPMIEMAKNHYRFIRRVLYLYNEENPLSEHRMAFEKQMQLAKYIRSLPPYASLD